MRQILRIARTELASLFYSPIAWILLVVLACHVGINFMNITETIFGQTKALGRIITFSLTNGYLIGLSGLYETIQHSLYLYIPLLTMGLMSRELSSGSIKLLYSSPVSSFQIIAGKYMSMVFYALVLAFILFLPIISLFFSVSVLNTGMALSGLLGLFLLICAYMAIGLFMSCLTSYQVVAAVATFSALAFLGFVGGIGQGIPFVREITYWFSISGRASEMVNGLICSDDVVYFVVVIGLFLGLSILKINGTKVRYAPVAICLRYLALVCVAILVGFASSRASLMTFFDATQNKRMTLAPESQEIVGKLTGPLTITTFCNILDVSDFDIGAPKGVSSDKKRFKQYLRFKPEIKMEYVYYYAPPVDQSIYTRFPDKTLEEIAREVAQAKRFNFKKLKTIDEVKARVDLASEEYRFVRLIERGSGERSFLRIYDDMLRHPSETEISVALKKLIVPPIKIGFVTGHGERDAKAKGDHDYSIFASSLSFRQSMINQGFDVISLRLDSISRIPSEINILLIAEMRTPLQPSENRALQKYIDEGGNLLILTDTRRQSTMNPLLHQFGVEAMAGIIVQPSEIHPPNLITSLPTQESVDFAPLFKRMFESRLASCIAMTGAVALQILEQDDFKIVSLLASPPDRSWVEFQTVNVLEDPISLDTLKGEKLDAYITAVAATRTVNDKEQRIFIIGDADCISNAELMLQRRAGISSENFSLIPTTFRWLSQGEFPIVVRREPLTDIVLHLEASHIRPLKILYIWVIPIILGLAGFFTCWSRRRR